MANSVRHPCPQVQGTRILGFSGTVGHTGTSSEMGKTPGEINPSGIHWQQ
ncbi:hypothetical protein CKA32_006737 [Geitlerinema sp. FC II]|nr:hypothetical protein CKA32_006737 [Geitlerinema sp. FC II]